MTDEQNRTVADEVGEDIQKIKEEFKSEPETVSLNINRVPKYVSDELKGQANEKFAGDYGMALTFWHLRNRRVEELQDIVNDLISRIFKLENRFDRMESEEDENNTDGIKTVN